jgi:hypothetical protein
MKYGLCVSLRKNRITNEIRMRKILNFAGEIVGK